MIYGLYVVQDEKTSYLQVMQDSNDATALRNFEFSMTKPDTIYSQFRSDFRLYRVGGFDNQTGEIVIEQKKLLASGADFVPVLEIGGKDAV